MRSKQTSPVRVAAMGVIAGVVCDFSCAIHGFG